MLAGSLSDFSIDDIFQLFALTKKSGALHVKTAGVEARVHFSTGDVIFAVADIRRMALGARLVGAGLLTEDQLRTVASDRNGGGALEFAVSLLTSDIIDTSVVEDYLRDEIHESVGRLLRLSDGHFTFDNVAADWPGPSFTSADLLVEGRRRLDEWETISAHVPALDVSLSLVPTLADGTHEITVTREQWQTLGLIDGRRTATDLVDLTGKGEFATCKLLAGLIAAGLVELRPTDRRTALEELLAGREALRKLEDVNLGSEPAAADGTSGREPAVDHADGQPQPGEDDAEVAADDEHGIPAGDIDAAEIQDAAPQSVDADDEAPEPTEATGGDEWAGDDGDAHHDASADEEEPPHDDSSGDDDSQPRGRRDVNVDRVQMARELASLGFGDEAPLRRMANRAKGANAAKAAANDAEAPAAETMVEHRLAPSDPNRGAFMRLIGGVNGA